MGAIKVEKVPSPRCPKCGSEYVFTYRSRIICDSCESITAKTSDFIEDKKEKVLKQLLKEIGDF